MVWFKRDLRVTDHHPLTHAAVSGAPVIALYVFEPELLGAAETDPSHVAFVIQSLRELDEALRARGTRLTIRTGKVPDVFNDLQRALGTERPITALWSHEETGLGVTYARDLRVHAWCASQGVRWTEIPQHGVIRRLHSRDAWATRWGRRMNETPIEPPSAIRCVESVEPAWWFGAIPDHEALGIGPSGKPHAQGGGESRGLETLRSFLAERGVNYRADMSSPLTGAQGCSRLSPHLAFGTVSMRTAHYAARERERELRADSSRDPRWAGSIRGFRARLRWHCHFIQKLESEPGIEFRNMNRAYDHIRIEDPSEWDEPIMERFNAWRAGRTGYPFIDACMRCLHATGWMNFRMRSMLVSFACHDLWLHWKPCATVLARHFLDFEPGIHFSQFQMQSGVTGINTLRIYNPIKQSMDQDPAGIFIRRWVPELADLHSEDIHEPRRLATPDAHGLFDHPRIAPEYPAPIVEHTRAAARARERIAHVRNSDHARAIAREVYQRHGSRSRPRRFGAR